MKRRRTNMEEKEQEIVEVVTDLAEQDNLGEENN